MARSRRIFGNGAKPPEGSGSGIWRPEAHEAHLAMLGLPPFQRGFRILGQVAREDGELLVAVEGPRADGLARQRIADDARQLLAVSLRLALARRPDRGQSPAPSPRRRHIRRAPSPGRRAWRGSPRAGHGCDDADGRPWWRRARCGRCGGRTGSTTGCSRRSGSTRGSRSWRARGRRAAGWPPFSAASTSISTICRSSRAKWSRKNGRTTCVL